jgi:putative salt-induced outer membrane protein YdiY
MNASLTGSLRYLAVLACGSTLLLSAIPRVTAADPAAAPAPEKKPKWETSAGLGATLTSGNSESIMVAANFLTQYKQEKDEFRFALDAGYGEAKQQPSDTDPDPDMEKNTSYIRGAAQYNRLFSERLFGYARVEAMNDDIADVTYRVTLSPGLGYYFIKNAKTTLNAEVGPGYVFEKLRNDETGDDAAVNDYATLRVGERLEHKLSKSARLWQSVEFIPEVTDFENFLVTFTAGIEADITQKLRVQVYVVDVFDNVPAPDRDDNDLKLVAGLKYVF